MKVYLLDVVYFTENYLDETITVIRPLNAVSIVLHFILLLCVWCVFDFLVLEKPERTLSA